MDPTRYRRLLIGLGTALVVLVGVVWIANPSGTETSLPEPVERVFPPPGDTVVRQTAVEVDLPIGYRVDIVVDGRPVPPAEIAFTEPLGQFRWQPGPGKLLEQWTPGEHTIEISWDRIAGGRPDPGSFTWTFRVI